MLKIAVGTKSETKLRILGEVLEEININTETISFDVSSGVSPQPRTEKETREGSINRARNAIAKSNSADIGIGIEIGYEPIEGILYMHGVSSIVDKSGNVYSEQSSTLELPSYFHKFLHDNESDGVGFHVQDFKDKRNDLTWKYFAEIIQYRKPFIRESLRNVLLRYIYRSEY